MAVLVVFMNTALKASNVPVGFSSLPGRQTMAVMVCRCGKELPLKQALLLDIEISPM
jgi:hypothetical protein